MDDEPTTLEMIEMFLDAEGYENVVTVSDATRALQTISEAAADLVLLDLMMPGLGGIEILRLLRDDSRLSRIPVIAFSSTSDREKKLEALELGAAEFLAKPVDASELSLRVRNTLAYRAYRERFGSGDAEQSHDLFERIDRAIHGELPRVRSRHDGDPRYQKTIEKFVSRLELKLEWMKLRLEAEEFDDLAALAHWLKGSAAMVGFDVLTGPADTLQILAEEGKRDGAEAALRELHGLAARIEVTAAEDEGAG